MSDKQQTGEGGDLWANALGSDDASGFKPLVEDNRVVERATTPRSLEALGRVPVTLEVELGRTMMKVADLLLLKQGSVVELDKLIGESLDIKVNGNPVAKGEVVNLQDKFGIRIIEVNFDNAALME